MQPTALDHVALYTADRDGIAAQLCDRLEMRVIDRTERYTLVGASGAAGKLTLFDPPGEGTPRPLRLVSVMLAEDHQREPLTLSNDLTLTFTVAPSRERHSVVGLTLRSFDPPIYAARYAELFGFEPIGVHPNVATLKVGESMLTLVRELISDTGQQMLFHLGLLVDSAQHHFEEAQRTGIEVVDFVDAPNTLALFCAGPESVCIEYVEHKQQFALT